MSTEKGKKKTKAATVSNVVSWQQKRILACEEEKALQKDIEELKTWTITIDKMDEDRLKKYVRNRPCHLKTMKAADNDKPRKRVQQAGKEKSGELCRIMDSVWKFHNEDDNEGSSTKSNNT